eukprot:COSAG02_NODE_261_length_26663_cov_210.330899_18_plen_160_part_00
MSSGIFQLLKLLKNRQNDCKNEGGNAAFDEFCQVLLAHRPTTVRCLEKNKILFSERRSETSCMDRRVELLSVSPIPMAMHTRVTRARARALCTYVPGAAGVDQPERSYSGPYVPALRPARKAPSALGAVRESTLALALLLKSASRHAPWPSKLPGWSCL